MVIIATGFGYHVPDGVTLDDRWAREAAGRVRPVVG
jgi:hypothetical protein